MAYYSSINNGKINDMREFLNDDARLERMRLMVEKEREFKRKIQDNKSPYIPQSPSSRNLDEIKDEITKHITNESRSVNDVVKVSVLTEENKRLKEQYAELMKKTNILIDAYRKLKTENETFVKKKNKNDYRKKMISDIKKFFTDIVNDIIKWFNS